MGSGNLLGENNPTQFGEQDTAIKSFTLQMLPTEETEILNPFLMVPSGVF